MRNAIYVMTIAAVMSVATPSWATDKDGATYVQGPTSCGKYVADRKAGRSDSVVLSGWVAGFLTAYNWTTPDTYSILGNSDLNSALLWLDNHCMANPLSTLVDGMTILVNELYPKRHRIAPRS